MHDIVRKLEGGDRRSIGRANEVVDDVLKDAHLFSVLLNGTLTADPLIRMRAADAVEKITREHPEYLQPHKTALILQVAQVEQQEVRWHVAQMMPRLVCTSEERECVAGILFGYLDDQSKIVQTNAMQALADIAEVDERLLPRVFEVVEDLAETGSPAVRSRARKLLAKLRRLSLDPA